MGAPEYIKIVEAIKNKITSQELEPGTLSSQRTFSVRNLTSAG